MAEEAMNELSALNCAVCCESYKRPKILNCLHSFCEDCLTGLPRVVIRSNAIYIQHVVCPVCQQSTVLPKDGASALRTNTYLVGLVDEVTRQKQVLQSQVDKCMLFCGSCEQQNAAVSHCLDCAVYLCLNCQTVHRRLALLSQHKIASLGDIASGKFDESLQQPRDVRCHKHPGEKSLLFCTTCHELVCVVCAVFDRPNHAYVPLEKASSLGRVEAQVAIEKLSKLLPAHEASLESLWKAREDFNNNIGRAKAEVQQSAEKLREEITKREQQILVDIDRLSKAENIQFNNEEAKMVSVVQGLHYSLQTASTIVERSTDNDFLSVLPIIRKRLDSLTKEKMKIDDHSKELQVLQRTLSNFNGCLKSFKK